MDKNKHIGIIGAGLIGSVLSIYLARRGYQVSLYERRDDVRVRETDEGRSINLALSTRGIRTLEELGLATAVKGLAIPMHGRMMHDRSGKLSYLPYGKEGQFINSISRSGLNQLLLDEAENRGVSIKFNHRCTAVDLKRTSATFHSNGNNGLTESFDLLIGADGAFSVVRTALQFTDRFNYSQFYLEHGYKELTIPADSKGAYAMEPNALHIWPRESFMMIALPNPDRTFTCTLFLPFDGEVSLESLDDNKRIHSFFSQMFPDALALMPGIIEDYRSNPASSLVTIKCFPWLRNNTLVIGDAAHGIVPFYGQGMNAGFEDCRILNMLLDERNEDWDRVLRDFQEVRKTDTDAIAELAFDNFIEMRDLVADPDFLLRKKIESKLHELFPDRWIPLYSMVTFNDNIPYSEAHRKGKKQSEIMDSVMKTPGIEQSWMEMDFRSIVDRLG